MNILPKKRWHVRTKENIARVRRDEAQAAEEEKAIQERAQLAEREARRQLLLQRSRNKSGTSETISSNTEEPTTTPSSSEIISAHVNFFTELEEGTAELKQTNKEHDKELKEEKEKYEKQIGYLTYLGQDTNEALGKKSWYEVLPERYKEEKVEVNLKSKVRDDPLAVIKKMTQTGQKIEDNFKSAHKFEEYKSLLHKPYGNNDSSRSRKRKCTTSSRESSEERQTKRKKYKNKKKNKEKKSKKKKYRSQSVEYSVSESSNDHESSSKVSDSENEEDKHLKSEKQKNWNY